MILGIDASQANRKIRSGTEWYAFYLIREFKKLIGGRGDIRVRLYLRDEPRADLAQDLPENFQFKILRWPLKYFWGQIRLSWEMLVNPPDVLFCPAHTIPLIHPHTPSSSPPIPPWRDRGRNRRGGYFSTMRRGRLRGGRTYTTLHDVGFEDYPELYDKLSLWYHRFAARLAVKRASHIFTVSEFSKERIIENYQCDPNKISVTHLGIANFSSAEEKLAILEKYGLKERGYALFVGWLEPKKNILNIVKAYELLISSLRAPLTSGAKQSQGTVEIASSSVRLKADGLPHNDTPLPDLVLAGRKIDIREVEAYLASRPKLAAKIKFLGYIEEADKPALYAGASVFLFPTLYEGFGLPILEAQAAGTPVITSNTASNPEIAGNGAVIVDPESPYEIAAAIKQLLTDENLREQKIRLGLENVKKFSWQETARLTLKKIFQPLSNSPLARGEGKNR